MFRIITLSFLLTVFAGALYAHGNVVPSAVDVEGLPPLDDWGTENPYRDTEGEVREKIIETGQRGYGQNCVNCHGLEAVSGGIAPDLRMLEP
ncbi:MAG: cytochrome c-550 PedF, partial [Proteobacteria bacterium]|nr:cytochrome c-550 PedF [Pseudomonadota bacterium]